MEIGNCRELAKAQTITAWKMEDAIDRRLSILLFLGILKTINALARVYMRPPLSTSPSPTSIQLIRLPEERSHHGREEVWQGSSR